MIRLVGDAFEAIWSLPIEDIDEPNLRGKGQHRVGKLAATVARGVWPALDGTEAVYVKRQAHFYCRPLWNCARRTPTLRRELRYLQRASQAGVRVPDIVAYGEGAGGRAVLVLREIRGAVDLNAALAAHRRSRNEILTTVAQALAALHRAGIYHGALYPKHLLIGATATFAVTLIDFEKAHALWPAARAARADLARLLRRAPFLDETDVRHFRAVYRRARSGTP